MIERLQLYEHPLRALAITVPHLFEMASRMRKATDAGQPVKLGKKRLLKPV